MRSISAPENSEGHALVVSLHDVSPATFLESQKICTVLESVGVTRISLLVIPDHHRRGHFLANEAFLDWLKSMVARGHEAVIHGYYHQREIPSSESLQTKAITRFYTAGEGEFYDIDEVAAETLLKRARNEFQSAGFNPVGFIAPAWLLSEKAKEVLKLMGFQYTTLLQQVLDFKSDSTVASQSLVYSTRAAWRRACSLAWNRYLFSRLQRNPLLRLGIHPPEIRFPRIWNQILDLAGQALQDRSPMTYQDWIATRT